MSRCPYCPYESESGVELRAHIEAAHAAQFPSGLPPKPPQRYVIEEGFWDQVRRIVREEVREALAEHEYHAWVDRPE